jgi:hypothetical protein
MLNAAKNGKVPKDLTYVKTLLSNVNIRPVANLTGRHVARTYEHFLRANEVQKLLKNIRFLVETLILTVSRSEGQAIKCPKHQSGAVYI